MKRAAVGAFALFLLVGTWLQLVATLLLLDYCLYFLAIYTAEPLL